MSHKTLVFPHIGSKLEVQTVKTYPIKDGYVKIAVDYASPSPLEVWKGHMGLLTTFPHIPGGDIVGKVLEVGANVHHVKKGDQVFSFDFGNVEGEAGQAIVVVRGNRVGKIPAGHDPASFISVPCSLATAYHSLSNDLKLRIIPFEDPSRPTGPLTPEEATKRILVWGASSTAGQYFVQVLAQSGYKDIIAVASSQHHATLMELGATKTVDYRSYSYAEDIGEKVDLVADCIGDREETISKIAKVVKNSEESIVAILLPVRFGGRGATSVKMELDEGALPDKVQVSLVRTHFYERNEFLRDNLQPRLIEQLVGNGTIKPTRTKLVEGSNARERYQKAIDLLAAGEVSGEKLVVDVSDLRE